MVADRETPRMLIVIYKILMIVGTVRSQNEKKKNEKKNEKKKKYYYHPTHLAHKSRYTPPPAMKAEASVKCSANGWWKKGQKMA
jgi:hypothetical protein